MLILEMEEVSGLIAKFLTVRLKIVQAWQTLVGS